MAVTVGVAVDAMANSGAGVGIREGEGSPQATPLVTASARTPMTKYLFNLTRGPGSARVDEEGPLWFPPIDLCIHVLFVYSVTKGKDITQR